MTKTGLDLLLESPQLLRKRGRLALLYNQASITSKFVLAVDAINMVLPGRLKTLFGPQHGVGLTEQDNMIESSHEVHPKYGIPVYSLYESSRIPSPEMLEDVDTVLVDIQDVGTRVYTFATTVLYLMKVCAGMGKAVVILDRPNPINGRDVEGNVLNPEYESFVGPYPIPMRHGMTLGELMLYYNGKYRLGCDLEIIRMEGWERNQYFDFTGLPWAMPSPNMPTLDTAIVYPGQVVIEGCGLSEGRGTTRPFEIFGAPYFDTESIMKNIDPDCTRGMVLREITFTPTFNKFANRTCYGFQIHVTDRNIFKPYLASLAIIGAVSRTHGSKFELFEGPYEYVFDRRPIDVIVGDRKIADAVISGAPIAELESDWAEELREYEREREEYLLYN